MRYVLHKSPEDLTPKECWYLNRYIGMSPELKEAYELKELYKKWQESAKEEQNISVVKAGLEAFYRKVEETENPAFFKSNQNV